MKPLLLTALLSVAVISVFAQKSDSTKRAPIRQPNPNERRNGYETYQSTSQIVGSGPYTMINTIDHRYEGLRGNQYFLPEWNKGNVEMVAGQNYKNIPLKFDAFRQNLVLLRPWVGNDSIIINADQVKAFQFNDPNGQTYLFRHLVGAQTDDESLKNGYFMVLYQDKTALLKRIAKTFKKADYKDAYSTGVRYDEFRNSFSYYVLRPDNTLTKVKLAEKSLIDALPDRQDALKTLVKQQNIRVKTEADAINLLKQYDGL